MKKGKRICEELKQLRHEKFLTQDQMAQELGVTKVTYNHIEKGYKDLSLKTIEKISKYTGHGYSYIKEHL